MQMKDPLDMSADEIDALSCEYCGRCCLSGPPCCGATQAIFDAQTLAAKEIEHARACQSRADKSRERLQKENAQLRASIANASELRGTMSDRNVIFLGRADVEPTVPTTGFILYVNSEGRRIRRADGSDVPYAAATDDERVAIAAAGLDETPHRVSGEEP